MLARCRDRSLDAARTFLRMPNPPPDFQSYVRSQSQGGAAVRPSGAPDYAFSADVAMLRAFERMRPVELAAASVVRASAQLMDAQQLGTMLRVTDKQIPHLHHIAKGCADTLGIALPKLYVANSPVINAYTFGTNQDAFIVVHAALVDQFDDDELCFVIGHEMGHIQNRHVVYGTVLRVLKTSAAIFLRWIIAPAEIALATWSRRAEITCDRAGLLCSRDLRSALASYALNRAQWNALVVARNDDNSQFGNFNNWALSGGYRVTDALRAVASVGTSFQAPTFNQLYYPGFGNPALLPQRNRASELGLKYRQGNVSLGAVVYNNDIHGFIVPTTNEQSALAVLRGVTLSADVQSGDTSYSLSYDYADPRSYSTSAALNDLRLVRIARNMLNARVTQRLGDVSVFGELRLSGDREDNNLSFSGRDLLPGYTLLNIGANWKLRKDLSVLARANNLTDAQYMLANGFSMPGRNVFVSLNWSL